MLPAFLSLILSGAVAAPAVASAPEVFPMAVWYGGGKVRP
jgi:hypothetical protein